MPTAAGKWTVTRAAGDPRSTMAFDLRAEATGGPALIAFATLTVDGNVVSLHDEHGPPLTGVQRDNAKDAVVEYWLEGRPITPFGEHAAPDRSAEGPR